MKFIPLGNSHNSAKIADLLEAFGLPRETSELFVYFERDEIGLSYTYRIPTMDKRVDTSCHDYKIWRRGEEAREIGCKFLKNVLGLDPDQIKSFSLNLEINEAARYEIIWYADDEDMVIENFV